MGSPRLLFTRSPNGRGLATHLETIPPRLLTDPASRLPASGGQDHNPPTLWLCALGRDGTIPYPGKSWNPGVRKEFARCPAPPRYVVAWSSKSEFIFFSLRCGRASLPSRAARQGCRVLSRCLASKVSRYPRWQDAVAAHNKTWAAAAKLFHPLVAASVAPC